ncbi:MAG: hypothetical protein ACRCS9_08810 [Hyphomicrobium sp.]
MAVVTPRIERASLAHLLAMAAAPEPFKLSLSRRLYRVFAAQMSASEAYALFEDSGAESPAVVAGGAFLPLGGVEAWCVVRPGGLRPASLLSLVRLARRRMSEVGQRAICFVRIENEQGARLARLCGFVPGEAIADGCLEWRRDHEGG